MTDNFGLRLRGLIERKGLSIERFADQFGVARSTAHAWLKSPRAPLEKHWQPLSDFFGCSVQYLATGRISAYGGSHLEQNTDIFERVEESRPFHGAHDTDSTRRPVIGAGDPQQLLPATQPAAEDLHLYLASLIAAADGDPKRLGWLMEEIQARCEERRLYWLKNPTTT